MSMDAKQVVERVLILAVLFFTILHLGGAVGWADLIGGASLKKVETVRNGMAQRYCRAIGFPHSTDEACHHALRLVR